MITTTHNLLQFSVRERAWLSTEVFTPGATEPGQTLFLSVNPLKAFLAPAQTGSTPETSKSGVVHYASTAVLLLSRYRDMRYVGTKISLVPAATTGSVDPAHINDASGVQNSMNPKDISNLIHWRRWLGANIALPFVTGTATTGYTLDDAYDLDAAWMSDAEFNHAAVTDGFSVVVRPKLVDTAMSASAVGSVFGIRNVSNLAIDASGYSAQSRVGQTALRPSSREIYTEGWSPNPLAGLKYTTRSPMSHPGEEECYISGVNSAYPWYADAPYASISTEVMLSLLKYRYTYPALILRLPPAYGTKLYWTLYMRHLMEFRRPYIASGQWTAGSITPYRTERTGDASEPTLVAHPEDADKYSLHVYVAPDPYLGTGNSVGIDFGSTIQASEPGEDITGAIASLLDDTDIAVAAPPRGAVAPMEPAIGGDTPGDTPAT